MKAKVCLSQCMIVKNEEKNIRRALTWGKHVVKEQIVVDTGSTDRTVEIALEMGAKVFHYKWEDDFSAAKNYAIEQASGNWIVFLDADEYFSSKDAIKMLLILKKIETGEVSVNGKKPHVLQSALADIREDGAISSVMRQQRIFQNVEELRYRNRIHEQIYYTGTGELVFGDLANEITVFHTGYTRQAFADTNKVERNIHLLTREIEENPEDYTNMVYLGEAFEAGKKVTEAEEVFERVLLCGFDKIDNIRKLNLLRSLIRIRMNRDTSDDDPKMPFLYKKALEVDPFNPDCDFFIGVWKYDNGHFKEALEYFKKSLKKQEENKSTILSYLPGNLENLYTYLIDVYLKLSDSANAVKYIVLILRLNKYNENALNGLLRLFRSESESDIYTFIWKLYDKNSLKDKLFVIKSLKIMGFPTLSEKIISDMTDEERKWFSES
jgi:glycosyltransferase involved in cell wall biosynthesis